MRYLRCISDDAASKVPEGLRNGVQGYDSAGLALFSLKENLVEMKKDYCYVADLVSKANEDFLELVFQLKYTISNTWRSHR